MNSNGKSNISGSAANTLPPKPHRFVRSWRRMLWLLRIQSLHTSWRNWTRIGFSRRMGFPLCDSELSELTFSSFFCWKMTDNSQSEAKWHCQFRPLAERTVCGICFRKQCWWKLFPSAYFQFRTPTQTCCSFLVSQNCGTLVSFDFVASVQFSWTLISFRVFSYSCVSSSVQSPEYEYGSQKQKCCFGYNKSHFRFSLILTLTQHRTQCDCWVSICWFSSNWKVNRFGNRKRTKCPLLSV